MTAIRQLVSVRQSAAVSSRAIEKRAVFLSHAETDKPIAQVINDEIRRVFANGVDIFQSSVPGAIDPGADWLGTIHERLEAADVVIVLITPVSITRPWIWFEIGASWSRMTQQEGRILPVCVPEIDKGRLPAPLSRLQALSLGDAQETRLLFETLCEEFGFGSMEGFDYETISSKLPRYDDLPVAEPDRGAGGLGVEDAPKGVPAAAIPAELRAAVNQISAELREVEEHIQRDDNSYWSNEFLPTYQWGRHSDLIAQTDGEAYEATSAAYRQVERLQRCVNEQRVGDGMGEVWFPEDGSIERCDPRIAQITIMQARSEPLRLLES
jgi:hypothetical protein